MDCSQWRSRVIGSGGGNFGRFGGNGPIFGKNPLRGQITKSVQKVEILPCGYEILKNFALRARNLSIILTKFRRFYSKLTICKPIFEPFWRQNRRLLGNF